MKTQEEEEEAQKPTNPNPSPPPTVRSPPRPQPQPQSPDTSHFSDHTSHSHEFSPPQKNNKPPPQPQPQPPSSDSSLSSDLTSDSHVFSPKQKTNKLPPQPQPQPPSSDSSLSSDLTSHSHVFSSPQKNNKLPPQPQPQPPSPDASLFSDHTSHSHEFSPPRKNNKLPPDPPSPPHPPVVTKVGPTVQDGFVGGGVGGGGGGGRGEEVEEGGRGIGDGGGSGRRRLRPDLSILKRVRRDSLLKKVLLGFRICGFVSCLVSFSVMAADRDQGWALDSFYVYKEFRYCMAINVIGFAYSGLQLYDLVYRLTTGKLKRKNQLRYYLDFSMDQILTYLLLSASSSAAVRVDDWESNWGKDKFTQMARASVGLSFLAFVALAFSSLISGYTLCTR